MIVVERKPTPVYEVKCWECGSKIHYKASEASSGFISCPVCGVAIMANKIQRVKTEVLTDDAETLSVLRRQGSMESV